MDELSSVIDELKRLSTPEHFSKLAHFGIKDDKALGVKVPLIRQLAKTIGKNHELSIELWKTEIHEARLLATMIENPKLINNEQFDSWVGDFNSWDICDQCCGLLIKTPFAEDKIIQYANSDSEFVKRTAFVLICALSVHDKKASDEFFIPFFDLIERESWDERNFVRKAVNWALRQIGKRNDNLRLKAVEVAERILQQDSKSARWIASDALRELNNDKIIKMVNKKNNLNVV
jgi:3-methyladenine DNA glycosylase AlkD